MIIIIIRRGIRIVCLTKFPRESISSIVRRAPCRKIRGAQRETPDTRNDKRSWQLFGPFITEQAPSRYFYEYTPQPHVELHPYCQHTSTCRHRQTHTRPGPPRGSASRARERKRQKRPRKDLRPGLPEPMDERPASEGTINQVLGDRVWIGRRLALCVDLGTSTDATRCDGRVDG